MPTPPLSPHTGRGSAPDAAVAAGRLTSASGRGSAPDAAVAAGRLTSASGQGSAPDAAVAAGRLTSASGLAPVAFPPLPLGAVRPTGWLRDQLQIQADGLTGHLGEVWPDLGAQSGWRGGDGESWERGPYYLDGLVPLAHLLADPRLLAVAEPFLEWILASGSGGSALAGARGAPLRPTSAGSFGPTANDDWWPRMVAAKVLTQHADATGDPRVVPFLTDYFHYQLATLPTRPLRDWGQARAADGVLSVYWLYERTGEPFLLDLADLLLRQAIDWTALFADWPYRRPQTQWDHRIHVVNVAMALKFPALRYRLTRDGARERQGLAAGIAAIWKSHGQAHGMFSGDEWLAGTEPTRGVETCAIVESLYSFATLLQTFGDAAFGDRIEQIAYNALPACQSPDQWLHQYDQQCNQVCCTLAQRPGWSNNETANLFGLEPNFGCCTANLHQGWPKLVSGMWGRAPDGGLAALVYGPCIVRAGGVTVQVETEYPFREGVRLVVRPDREGTRLALHLRVPGWCMGVAEVQAARGADAAAARVSAGVEGARGAGAAAGRACAGGTCTVTGEAPVALQAGGWHVVDRAWHTGDVVTLHLPMTAERVRRPSGGVVVQRGPLVYALGVGEQWRRLRGEDPVPDFEVLPQGAWNYGLVREAGLEVREAPVARQPFAAGEAPVRIGTLGRRVPGWGMDGPSAAELPPAPVVTAAPVEGIELVPYGAARLRVTELPEVEGEGEV